MASRNKFFSVGKLSNKSSSSSGLRIFWIPGRHKSHSKDRFDSTSKQLSHKGGQKKSEVWSLGGAENQRDLVHSDPDRSIFDGPSVSGISSAASVLGAVGSTEKSTTTALISATTTTPTITISTIAEDARITTTPGSTASTTPLIASVTNIPETATGGSATSEIIVTTTTRATGNNSINNNSVFSMPAKTTLTTVTTTTSAEIMDENRFSILGKDRSNEIDVYDLPSPPKNGVNTSPSTEGTTTNALLNTSAGTTTASTATTPSPSNTPKQHNGRDSMADSPKKKSTHHKNENNNHQNDINSIESISENTKLPSSDLEWIDEYITERNSKEMLNKRKKKKKITTAKELDQLDGVSSKQNTKDEHNGEDEKVVKCLYYTLMCCECSIS